MYDFDEKGRCRLSVSVAYEVAAQLIEGPQPAAHPAGFYVNSKNELKRITAPKKQEAFKDRQGRKLIPVSIESLCAADGDVNAVETNEVQELSITPQEPVRVAGEDTDVDEETERFEQAVDAAAHELNLESEEECSTETQEGSSSEDQDSNCEVSSD